MGRWYFMDLTGFLDLEEQTLSLEPAALGKVYYSNVWLDFWSQMKGVFFMMGGILLLPTEM